MLPSSVYNYIEYVFFISLGKDESYSPTLLQGVHFDLRTPIRANKSKMAHTAMSPLAPGSLGCPSASKKIGPVFSDSPRASAVGDIEKSWVFFF